MARGNESEPPDTPTYLNLKPALRSLLKNIKDRRISVPSTDAPDGPDDAFTPLNIVNHTQLQRWAEDDPERLYEVFSELREQRDLGLEATTLYETLINDYNEEKAKRRALKEQHSALRKELLQAQNAREDTSFSSQSASGKRTQKLPDPPLFVNGEAPTWDDWSGKIQDKLEINHDHYDSERAKIAYILSRLGGEAAEHTYARKNSKSNNPYVTADEMLSELSEIYEDVDRENTYREQYKLLVQGISSFVKFYSEFKRLFSHLSYNERQLMVDLKDKLSSRLRTA